MCAAACYAAVRRVLSEECLARLPDVHPVDITTACGPYVGLSLPDYKNLCGVSIMRSGTRATLRLSAARSRPASW
jgi:hypothetical protein